MMDAMLALLGRNGFLPHGYCFTWSPGLLWSMVGADAVIAASYFSIPLATISFVRKRPESNLKWVAWLFSAFIFACGVTHVMDIWTIWQPDYGLQALTKIATAAVSLVTAIMLWPPIPKALKIPSVQELQTTIDSLQLEIGKRRNAEDQLAATAQSLAVTLASIEAGFIATDRAGRVTHMNAVAEGFTGWPQREAVGQDLWTVFDRENRPPDYLSNNPVDLMLQLGITVETPHQVVAISRQGTRTPLEVKAALTRDDDGSVTGFAMVFRDVSRLAQAEAETKRLAAIVESSNDAIIGKTLDGRITSWNGAAQSIFGYPAAEAIGQSIQILIPPDRQDEEMRILRDLADGAPVSAFDTVRLTRSGEQLDMSIAISPIRDEHGRVVGASKIARDVTHQRRAERQAEEARLTAQRLEAENRQIHEASRLKSQFLANMSHELRTPLNAIIGFADLLHAGAVQPESPRHREFLGHIGTSGRHLLQLINDVLDLSKVESGKFEFFPEPVDLPALLNEVQNVLHTAIQLKRISVSVEIDPLLWELELDPARLKQVLYNFLSNAIKFTASGGRVSIRASLEGATHFRIEVEDTGIGISAADLPRLFTEFQQLDAGYTKQHQGTGLGLALTRRLVEAQGGRVGVRSALGAGSVFFVVLERVHGRRSSGMAAAASDTPRAEAGRVLVIKNDQRDQSLIVGAFSEAGFGVDTATDSDLAVRRARDVAYAALTLDLHWTDQMGLSLLARIRSHGASCASPVVIVTMPLDTDTAPTFAIENVLCKPIRSDEILAAMAKFRPTGSSRARVLVIDDDPAALDLMQATLTSIGIGSVGCLDGRQALSEIDTHRPDAIILDLMMPGFDGFQVLDELQRLPAWRHVPVFIWTSMLLTDDEYSALARSARAIMGKGGGAIADVLERVRRWRPPMVTNSVAPSD